MNIKQLLTSSGRKYNTAEILTKYCSKELKKTIDKFKETQDIKRLKANMRRLVELIIERCDIYKDYIIDYFSFDYLQFCEYRILVYLENGNKVDIPKWCDWKELEILLTNDNIDDFVKAIEKKQKQNKTILKLKQAFGGKITVE